jgi:magnesium-transporting ATPase (P-type)
MTAVTSAVVRDGRLMRVPSDQLVPGDVLILGERGHGSGSTSSR